MLVCPMCKKVLAERSRECPRCRADLSLLVDYAGGVDQGLARAASCTRAGDLGEAVWSYLEGLDADPENTEARRQVGRVAAAVRQFDRAAPGRRWLERQLRQARFRRWLASWNEKQNKLGWYALAAVLAAALFTAGFVAGRLAAPSGLEAGATAEASAAGP